MKKIRNIHNYYNIIIHIFLLIFICISIISVYKLKSQESNNYKYDKKSCLESYFSHDRFYLKDNSSSQVEIKDGFINFEYNISSEEEFTSIEDLLNINNLIKYQNNKIIETARLNDKDIQDLLKLIDDFIKKHFTTIKIEEYGCTGDNCQNYEVTIHGDGTVEYVGKKDVETLGEKTYIISEEKVTQIIDALYNFNYFHIQTDASNDSAKCTKIAIKFNGRYKENTICPKNEEITKFTALIQTINNLAQVNNLL